MMIKKIIKNILLSVLTLSMIIGMIPINYAHAASSELPKATPVLFPFKNEEDLKSRIINSPEFISQHAAFANYLGFGWAGGTASKYVGQDFDFKKSGDKYILQARYNKNDPYASGYMADKRLKMTISNVKFYVEPDSIVTGKEKVTNLDPQVVQQYQATNRGDSEDKATTNFTYTKSKSVLHSTNYSFSEGIAVKHTAKVSVLFLSAQMEYGWNFNAGQSWTDSNTDIDTSTVSTSYSTVVPPKSKRTIKLMSYKTQSDVPYTANIYMDYDITFSGFLRWGGNARSDHPGNRPFVDITFGSGDLTAPEEIERMYTNRHIPGFSNWDWGWMEKEYGANNIKNVVSNLTRRPKGAKIDGKFTAVNGTHVQVVAEDPVALTPQELGAASLSVKRLSPSPSMTPIQKNTTINDYSFQDNDVIHGLSTKIMTESGQNFEFTNK